MLGTSAGIDKTAIKQKLTAASAKDKDPGKDRVVKDVKKSFSGEVVDGRIVATFSTRTEYEPKGDSNFPSTDYDDDKKIFNSTDDFAPALADFLGMAKAPENNNESFTPGEGESFEEEYSPEQPIY